MQIFREWPFFLVWYIQPLLKGLRAQDSFSLPASLVRETQKYPEEGGLPPWLVRWDSYWVRRASQGLEAWFWVWLHSSSDPPLGSFVTSGRSFNLCGVHWCCSQMGSSPLFLALRRLDPWLLCGWMLTHSVQRMGRKCIIVTSGL